MGDPASPPNAVALRFINCINRGDVPGLKALITADHTLQVFDEPPLQGKNAVAQAWQGYADSFPRYVIHPHGLAVEGDQVAVLGHTTGSHLRLPDNEESALTLIWIARIHDGLLSSWKLVDDTPENRSAVGLD